jgi:hypothetical protein
MRPSSSGSPPGTLPTNPSLPPPVSPAPTQTAVEFTPHATDDEDDRDIVGDVDSEALRSKPLGDWVELAITLGSDARGVETGKGVLDASGRVFDDRVAAAPLNERVAEGSVVAVAGGDGASGVVVPA